jgi:transcriptional regulator with XRE-family HTH domain
VNALSLIELAPAPDSGERSPLASARLQRRLTVEEAARRAALSPDQVRWLEEGRVYRFPSVDDALVAALLLASALGIEHREALALAGRQVPPLERRKRGRLLVLAGLTAAATLLVGAVVVPARGGDRDALPAPTAIAPDLPKPWEISVHVLNGNGDINWTRRLASRVGAMGYLIEHVGKADRFDYPQTAVFYAPGGEELAVRLARQLGVVTRPLPGGEEATRLVVVVGPERGPGEAASQR